MAIGAFVSETAALTRRWLIHMRRERAMLVMGAMQPLMWLLLFGNLFKRIAEGREADFGTGDYIQFQTAGVVVMTVLSNAFMAGIPVLFDRESGFLDKMLVAPISRTSLFASRFIYVVIFSLGQVVIILVVAFLMGVRIQGGPLGMLQILFFTTLLAAAFTVLSMGLAFVFKHHAAFFAISGFLLTPCIFLSTALVPLKLMPEWMAVVAQFNPLTHAIEPVRAAMIDGYATAANVNVLTDAAFLAVFNAVALMWGLRVMRRAID